MSVVEPGMDHVWDAPLSVSGIENDDGLWLLLSPVTFFLFTLNMTFSFFDSFGLVHAVTQGGPGDATSILVYRAWKDGFEGLQLGYSAAQSVVLMALVIVLTAVQFRFTEKKVTY